MTFAQPQPRDFRITRGETFSFSVQPLDDAGEPVSTGDLSWYAVLDAVGPSGLPVRYDLPVSLSADGVVVLVSALLSLSLSTLSTYSVTSEDFDGNVTARAYGSIVLQGLASSTVWRTGAAAPSNAIGIDGDVYLQTSTGTVYVRTLGAYEFAASLVGSAAPQPSPGDGDGESAVTYTAAETMSALRVVCAADGGQVALARPPGLDALAPLGLVLQAASPGDPVRVARSGLVSDASWSWVPGVAVMLGPYGTLTQVQHDEYGFVIDVGVAVTPTQIVVRIAQPLWLMGG